MQTYQEYDPILDEFKFFIFSDGEAAAAAYIFLFFLMRIFSKNF
jgi:hypothetical protein